MIAGNEKPSLESVDPAMRARFVLVPFNVQIPEEERDPHLGAKLRAEAPKILSWMIQGALQWQAHSLAVPEVIRVASDVYLEEENIIQNFLDDETEVDAASNVPTQGLFSRYQEWCKNQGIQPQIKKAFKNDLIMLGFRETKPGNCRVINGLRLRSLLP